MRTQFLKRQIDRHPSRIEERDSWARGAEDGQVGALPDPPEDPRLRSVYLEAYDSAIGLRLAVEVESVC